MHVHWIADHGVQLQSSTCTWSPLLQQKTNLGQMDLLESWKKRCSCTLLADKEVRSYTVDHCYSTPGSLVPGNFSNWLHKLSNLDSPHALQQIACFSSGARACNSLIEEEVKVSFLKSGMASIKWVLVYTTGFLVKRRHRLRQGNGNVLRTREWNDLSNAGRS